MKREEYLRQHPEKKRTLAVENVGTTIPFISLQKLENRNVALDVFERGVRLQKEGKARQNGTYNWLYTVSGDPHPGVGTALYQVDLAALTCRCAWFEVTGSICKHIVASLLDYLIKEGVESP